MKNCLTIAGSDCSGGAGIQADLKTFSALGCYGMSAISGVVAENTERVISTMPVTPSVIYDQLEAVFTDIRVDAVKIGMLPDAGSMHAVAAALMKFDPEIVVCDPILAATAGTELMHHKGIRRHQGGGAESVCPRRRRSPDKGRPSHRGRHRRAVRWQAVPQLHARACEYQHYARHRLHAFLGDSRFPGAGALPAGGCRPCQGLHHRSNRTRNKYREGSRTA